MARSPLLAANWKMHTPPDGWAAKDSPWRSVPGVDVLVFPSFVHLAQCRAVGLSVGAQCGRAEEKGAFTGDISMTMLREEGCIAVLCGHSERRAQHGETDAQVAAQARAALAAGLHPVVCIGETLADRTAGHTETVLTRQLQEIDVPCTIAYEPVWAIGTGTAATPADIAAAHAFIRSLLPADRASSRILYGGSANATNAADFLAQVNVDGLLVGSASLQRDAFRTMVAAAASLPA
jgi:triosephosphate isomerase